jgi:hypothetical protein
MKRLFTMPENWFLPLTIASFVFSAVDYLRPIFPVGIRWGLMLLLGLYLFRYVYLNQSRFAFIVIINSLWATTTAAWSLVPELSMMKGIAYLLVSFILIIAGQVWVLRNGISRIYDFLWLFATISLTSAILGVGTRGSMIQTGVSELYQGYVSGPNMLGSMLAMSVPFIAWRLFYAWGDMRSRLIWISLLSADIVFLLLANSRAAIIAAAMGIIGLIFATGKKRWIPITMIAIVTTVYVVILMPTLKDTLVEKYIYKHASEEQGVLYTRERLWVESFELAKKGGAFGAGYGATFGTDASFEGGLTAVGYGREKGNSQLAIMEELGATGLVLYIILVTQIIALMRRVYLHAANHTIRVASGLAGGTLLGMLIQSIFEAWWVAPGSAEFVFFWVVVGTLLGLERVNAIELAKIRRKREKEARLEKLKYGGAITS